MPDFDPGLRPIEPAPLAPLSPLRARQRRGDGRAFDLERELEGEAQPEPDPDSPHSAADAPVAPRADDEAGGRLDVTA
jgi:hypothetical protein